MSKTGYQIYTVPAGQYLIGKNGKLNPQATLGYTDGVNYFTPDDWEDETFKTTMRQEYNVGVSGGSDNFSFIHHLVIYRMMVPLRDLASIVLQAVLM